MSLTLSTIAAAMADAQTVATAVTTVITTGKTIYEYVSELMEDVQAAYEGQTDAGETKKAAVLAAAKVVIESLGEDWDSISDKISAFIDSVKAAYNKAKTFFSDLFDGDDDEEDPTDSATATA